MKRPDAVLLAHGACTGPSIFDHWARWFPGATVSAVDLQAGLQLERATMDLYAGAVVAEAGRLPWPLLLCGYSMGGLVALIAAATLRPELLVMIEPFPPAEIGGSHPEIQPGPGLVQPDGTESAGGPVKLRPDSALAMAQLNRGISIPPPLPFRSLVVFGDACDDERGPAIARLYGSDELLIPGMDHLGLVLDERVPEAIARYAGFGDPESGDP